MVYRRSCFKCGNVGHIAEVCPEPERLCYNCKQPGHESSNCPQPKSVDAKQCYTCVGHIQADCPSARNNVHRHQRHHQEAVQDANTDSINTDGEGVEPPRCYNCGRVGHFARKCHSRPQVAAALGNGRGAGFHPRGGGRGRGRGRGRGGSLSSSSNHAINSHVVCYNCGGPNHFARDCQAPSKSVKCYQCGKFGHIAHECTYSSGENRYQNKVCFRCNEQGHIARDCTASPHEDDGDDEDEEDEEEEEDDDEEEESGSSQQSTSPTAARPPPTKRRTDDSDAESDVDLP